MNDFIVFGEILFDCFGDTSTLGGAPLNAGIHLSRLGLKGRIVSAVGDDSLGHRALEEARAAHLDVSAVAVSGNAATGRADVVMRGTDADYVFNGDAAWDAIPYPDSIEERTRILYFGTLAQRSKTSRETLASLIRNVKAEHIFYDVNIRKHFYSEETVRASLAACTILKMNSEELPLIERLSGESGVEGIMEHYSIDTVLVTEGSAGAFAVCRGAHRFRAVPSDVPVADTVGAGDAFSAGFLAALVKGLGVERALKAGSVLADFTVSHRGAVPPYDSTITGKLKKAGVL